jgi:mannitol-specific phosphotransferase system IIBC component
MGGFQHIENDTIMGTATGTILSVIPNVESADLLRTLVLAIVGAVVSFIVTQLMKWILKRIKK